MRKPRTPAILVRGLQDVETQQMHRGLCLACFVRSFSQRDMRITAAGCGVFCRKPHGFWWVRPPAPPSIASLMDAMAMRSLLLCRRREGVLRNRSTNYAPLYRKDNTAANSIWSGLRWAGRAMGGTDTTSPFTADTDSGYYSHI